MIFEEFDQFGKLLGRLPVRARCCVDCLSGLYGEPVETVSEYLSDAEIASRQAHCGNCGEHKDIFLVLLPRGMLTNAPNPSGAARPGAHH